jgi:hypothetical protein
VSVDFGADEAVAHYGSTKSSHVLARVKPRGQSACC